MSGSSDKLSAEVVLGFLEDAEPWRLLSPQFPSKVGGKPAWLSLRGLPDLPELECEMCRLPLVFLLQVSGVWGEFYDPSSYFFVSKIHIVLTQLLLLKLRHWQLNFSVCQPAFCLEWLSDVFVLSGLCTNFWSGQMFPPNTFFVLLQISWVLQMQWQSLHER